MEHRDQAFRKAMTLAALSGLKVALGPAFLATSRRWPSRQNWVMAALGEMAFDKIGIFPARYRPSLLIPHTLAGAWVAHESMKEDGVNEPWAAAMGAAIAAGVATAAPLVRVTVNRTLGIPDALLGLGEDYLAIKAGSDAVGVPLEQLPQIAQESVGQLRELVAPALEHAGASR